ncbi:MAG TPA: transcription antitermination factor NusB [Spirochaetota bacterium]|nr:transcription antitermination factor NusB [Spirochaetota bacterium]HOM38910.1 transcription antitermination factor NusB [Spirochaetota bacterium]HPQ49111.1 transcription antitermination factor NusB [Spirochaetota bacterium]
MENKKKKSNKRKARELSIQALYQYEVAKKSYEELINLDWIVGDFKPNNNTVEYFKKILKNSIDNIEKIDSIIKELATKYPFHKIKPIDKAILRWGIAAMLCEDDIPYPVIINEGIEIAKEFSGIDSHKFINGVLDGARRIIEKDKRKDN